MLLLQCAIFFLLAVGVLLLLRLNPFERIKPQDIKTFGVQLLEKLRAGYKPTLKQRVERVQGKEKQNFLSHNLSDAKRILTTTNQKDKVQLMYRGSALCFCIGSACALAAQNVLLLPVLSLGFALIPMWFIKFSEFGYKKRLCNELEVALSVITSAYMRTNNLVTSVSDNLTYLNEPIRSVFSKFVNEVTYVDANVPNGIRNLKASIDNPVFYDWCDILTMCVIDRSYKESLLPVVEQFSDNKSLQNSLETIIQMPVREFATIVLIVLLTFPILYWLNQDWFGALTGTWGGKTILTVLSAVLFAGMNKAVGLSSPIE